MRLRRKKWAPETIARHPDTALNLDSLNNLPEFSYLEIGSGKGRFLLTMAKNNPSRKYLGIEMNYNAFSLSNDNFIRWYYRHKNWSKNGKLIEDF